MGSVGVSVCYDESQETREGKGVELRMLVANVCIHVLTGKKKTFLKSLLDGYEFLAF